MGDGSWTKLRQFGEKEKQIKRDGQDISTSEDKNGTWKVDWMTYKLGYILQRSCWPSFVRICCTIKSIATWLSPPRGMITSAYFFVGRIKSSKAAFTNLEYCIKIKFKLLVKTKHLSIKIMLNFRWQLASKMQFRNLIELEVWTVSFEKATKLRWKLNHQFKKNGFNWAYYQKGKFRNLDWKLHRYELRKQARKEKLGHQVSDLHSKQNAICWKLEE